MYSGQASIRGWNESGTRHARERERHQKTALVFPTDHLLVERLAQSGWVRIVRSAGGVVCESATLAERRG
jgi:hypothetical protein